MNPVPLAPAIPERTADEALCDRLELAARNMFQAFPAVSMNVALLVSGELLKIRLRQVTTLRARWYADIYEYCAQTPAHYEAITRFTDALRAVGAARGEELLP